ncbi:UbiA-like polyprenyltransferase [Candidatus Laterigemmans baculatus]|uniref:UbiA-like polyprenyltransferase n=1 Tax=Candidatus Laterigemmans baculatus TaxID=2770505 RepID=UPI0013DCA2FD|nr:UbiA-like polyprenyltransferase [Candidatus Laterigemmans baculatus]
MKTLLLRGRMLLELIRFSHTIFALPFAVLATVMAFRVPLSSGELPAVRPQDLLGILACMVLARSAAMAFNRVVDERFDAANPRTASRHLPAGLLRRSEAIGLTVVCSLGFVASTLLFLPNRLPLFASLPVLLFLLGYSLAKRFTSAAHLWLGGALSLAPICAWVAIRGEEVLSAPADLWPPVVLAAAVALWVAGFDIIYACQDEAFDRQAGLRSVPAAWGARGALRWAAAAHAAMVGVLVVLPLVSPVLGLGWLYYAAVIGIAALLWYEHHLVRPDDLERVGIAFFHVNAVVSVVLLLAASIDCWWV